MSAEKSRLDRAQQIVTTISIALTPLVVAGVTWFMQDSITEKTVARDYVSLAMTILQDDSKQSDPKMREWATDILKHYSPVKFGASLEERLREGGTALPRPGGSIESSWTTQDGSTVKVGSPIYDGLEEESLQAHDETLRELQKTFPRAPTVAPDPADPRPGNN
jgi:hypothetical protein